MKKHVLRNLITAFCTMLLSIGILNASSYYVDPASGSMSNSGTEASPWSTLAEVFSAGKTFVAGDIIYLKNGNHGFPNITQSNSGDVTIKSYPGHSPILNRLQFNGAVNWIVEGVRVYTSVAPPESPILAHPVSPRSGNFLIKLNSSSYVTFNECYVYSIEDESSWTANDWNYNAWNGLSVPSGSHHITINNCLFKNLNFALDNSSSATHVVTRHTTIKNFCGDAMRTSPDGIIEYNEILDGYDTNGNHDDAMQGFGTPRVTIRGNKIINTTSASRSFISYSLQGIGLFDGFFDNCTIENNLVVIHHWHAISIYGTRNSKIVNNTVVDNPMGSSSNGPPWIAVYNHKDGSASSGNIMRNNITSNIESTVGTTASNNLVTQSYTSHFVNYAALDMRLKSTSSAINGGTTSDAPTIDLNQYPRSGNPDIGCYELGSVVSGGDTEVPSVPTGLSSGTVTYNSVALSWNASTDNTGVIGYKIYTNGTNPISVGGTSATVSGLSASTQYSFTVSAYDAAGNESAQSSAIQATTQQAPSGITSDNTFQSFMLSTQTGEFTATFDATPNGNNIDALTGIQNGSASSYGDIACIIRFNSGGQIDARDGGSYAATNTINYSAGILYHFRVEVNVPTHTYSVFVTPDGGSEQTVASNFAFRSEQASVSQLTGWTIYAYIGSHTVDNIIFSTGSDTQAPSVPTGLSAGTITSNSLDLSWSASTDNIGVTGYKVYTDGSNPVTVTGINATISGLAASTQYSFTVSAVDAASNESTQSSAIQVTTSGAPTTITVDETIQAEDYSSQSGCSVATNQAGYTGTGFLDYGGNGAWGEWTYTSLGDGTITLSLRYANGSSSGEDRQCALTVNSLSEGDIAFAATGGWTNWNTITIDIDVVEGSNTIRLTANTSNGGPNLDKLDLDGNVGGNGGSDTEVPSVPTGLASSNVTTSSVDLSWNASIDNVGVTGYKVYTDGSNPVTVTGTNTTISGLAASTQYSFTVSAVDAASNESAQSSALQVTTATPPDTEAPSMPTGLASSNVTTSSVDLSWNASTDNVGVTGYKVYTGGSNPVTVTGTSTTISGLAASTQYSFTVSAVDAASNESAQSSALQVTTSAAPTTITVDETIQAEDYSSQSGCSVATNQAGYTGTGFLDYGGNGAWGEWTYTSPGDGTITLSLRYANGSSSGGDRQCALTVNSLSEGNIAFAATGGWTNWNTITVDIDVVEGSNTIRLTANTGNGGPNLDKLDLDGNVGGSGGSDTEAPSIPTSLASSNVTTSSVNLSWNASTDNIGVTGYKVYTNGSNSVTVTGTSATISGLAASTQYSFTVSAIDAASNESVQSPDLQITTSAPTDTEAPSVPTGLASSSIYSSGFTLSWNASTDNVGVTIYEIFKDGASIGTTGSASMAISGLSPETTYSMTVRAGDAIPNWSAQSSALSVTTTAGSADEWPTLATTGYSGTLTNYSGNFTANTNGQIIENMNISGKVYIKANNVLIRNCKIGSLDISTNDSYTGCVVEDSQLDWAGRKNFTLRRCYMTGQSVDLIRVGGPNITIEDCFLYVTGPQIADSHSDVIQEYPVGTGTNLVVRHNRLYNEMDQTSIVISATDMLFENNLAAGAGFTLYTNSGQQIINNHFSTIFWPNCGYYGPMSGTPGVCYGNVWHETGAPLTCNSSAAIELTENTELGVKIYPNPLNGDVLNIQLNGYDFETINVNIYDLTGRSVHNNLYVNNQSELKIPVSNLNKGIYIVSVNGEQQKLVIE